MSHLFVTDLENEIDLVESYIQEYLRPAGLNQAVEDILSEVLTGSGKKIRPLLLLLAGRCGDHYQENRDRLCQLGALLEMVHLASLIHDDIVDDSPLRRGRPTIQSRFGKNMAVYAGDLVLSRVMNVLFNNHYITRWCLSSVVHQSNLKNLTVKMRALILCSLSVRTHLVGIHSLLISVTRLSVSTFTVMCSLELV